MHDDAGERDAWRYFGTDLARKVTGGLAQVPAAQAPSGFSFCPPGFGAPSCATSRRSVPLDQVHQGGKRPHIGGMLHLDLSDEEEAALAIELVQLISRAKYPFSDRVRTLGAILNKLRPEPVRKPPPPPKIYAPPEQPPRATAARRRRRG